MSPVTRARRAPASDQAFDADEVRSAEALLSGTGAGAEGGIVVPWPILFRHRIHRRLARSDRYQWWVLWTVLAGLLSVNITFTVFVVALPQVARRAAHLGVHPHLDVHRPAAGLRGGRPGAGQARRPAGLPQASTSGACRAPPSAWC